MLKFNPAWFPKYQMLPSWPTTDAGGNKQRVENASEKRKVAGFHLIIDE